MRDSMRSGEGAHHPAYHKWRERQKHRFLLEMGQGKAHAIIHAPMALELNKGCSVGCWFCGVSAPKLSEIWAYDEPNSAHWRSTLTTLKEILGPIARWGFCYWATDPLDNPDYEKFCSDFHEITGQFPQTTTALSLRDPQRTRKLLQLSEEKGCRINRFSILTLKNFLAVHQEYSARELAHVECIPQNIESSMKYTKAGKAQDRQDRTDRAGNLVVTEEGGTIACVSGFLINMVDGLIRMITPCAASSKWPLGYWVVREGRFASAEELGRLVLSWLDSLANSIVQLPFVRLSPAMRVMEEEGQVVLVSDYGRVSFRGIPAQSARQVVSLLVDGKHTAEELALLNLYTSGMSETETLALLERLFDLGCLDEEPVVAA